MTPEQAGQLFDALRALAFLVSALLGFLAADL